MSAPSANLFRKISPGRVSDEIVDQIKRAISKGQLSQGDRLPPERELTRIFGVSRVAVRDALRVLEASGLIEVKIGASGGAVVTEPGSDEIAAGISNMLLVRTTTPQEVTEARLVIEVAMLGLVCKRAGPKDVTDLEEICDRADQLMVEDAEYDVALSAEFHSCLAKATHNQVIAVLIDSLHQPLEESLRKAREVDPAMGVKGNKEHRQLVRAISAGDADKAEAIMERHLRRTAYRLGA